jgi:hypothetical protein
MGLPEARGQKPEASHQLSVTSGNRSRPTGYRSRVTGYLGSSASPRLGVECFFMFSCLPAFLRVFPLSPYPLRISLSPFFGVFFASLR